MPFCLGNELWYLRLSDREVEGGQLNQCLVINRIIGVRNLLLAVNLP